MKSKKEKSILFIVISILLFIPNIGCLLVASMFLDEAPIILFIVPSVALIAAIVFLMYGISLRKKGDV